MKPEMNFPEILAVLEIDSKFYRTSSPRAKAKFTEAKLKNLINTSVYYGKQELQEMDILLKTGQMDDSEVTNFFCYLDYGFQGYATQVALNYWN